MNRIAEILPNYRAGGVEGRPKAADLWRTPPDLYRRLDAEFNFTFDAACTEADCLAASGLKRDEGRDGLLEPWGPDGATVWCNPPYSHTKTWMERAVLQARTRTVVMLIPSDTSTRYWRDNIVHASEVRFLTGRPRFHGPEGDPYYTKRQGGGTVTPCAVVVFTPNGGPPSYGYMATREK